nr:deaminase domain-containing protein [Pseudomonas cichorii]
MTPTVLQPLNIQSIKTSRLFLNIELALGVAQYPVSPERYSGTAQVSSAEHFAIVRLVLHHLLGADTTLSDINPVRPDADQERKLFLIYQSEKAWKLYADAMGTPVSEVTPWLVHQFFARMAWLEGPLTAVPADLRPWMMQFKRGARLMPIGEWIARSSAASLYNGMAVARDEQSRPVLSVVCDAISTLLPPGEYRDKALWSALEEKFSAIETWWLLEFYLKAMPESVQGLQLDFLTPTSVASRAGFYRKVAVHALNPEGAPWLADAISRAAHAPGMRSLSLASELRFRHASLSFESAMALAALLLKADLQSSPEWNDSLPTSLALNADIPRLDTWSTLRNADELFQGLGIDILCRPEGALRWRPSQTWHALSQTARFSSTFAPLLEHMKWYSGRQASPRVTQALAGRAIIDYFLGATPGFALPLEKTLQGAWVCEYSHVQLTARIRADIKARQPAVSACTLEMLYYLLLREALPELLVEGVPDHLQYGRSLQSVALIHGVALLAGMRAGHALAADYEELIGLSAQLTQSSDASVHVLWSRTLVVPALRYAIAHGVIAGACTDDLAQASAAQVSQALDYLKAQQAQHAAQLNELLAIKPPDRRLLARQMLMEAGVDQRLWELSIKPHSWPILQEHGFTIAASYSIDRLLAVGRPQASVLELVMMGEAYIAAKPSIPEAYASAFEAFHRSLIDAEARVMGRLLSEMQVADRNVLLSSTCEVSRMAFGQEEGSHGLFIRCQPGDHRADFHDHSAGEEWFYELIPAGGIVRKVTQRFQYKVEPDTGFSGNIVETVEKRRLNAEKAAKALITPLLPCDSDAYLKGTASRSSTVYYRPRQGTLIPAADLIYLAGTGEQVWRETFVRIAADHLFASFLQKSRVEHEHMTPWEQIWASEREYADIAARLVIPFYGCITDLAHGEHSVGVIAGCALDVAFALIPAGQFVGSTARIVLKAGEMSVLSLFSLTGKAVGRLIIGLAEQSALFAVRDMGKLVLKISQPGWARLLEQVPALKKLFASRALLESGISFDKGMYRVAQQDWHPRLEALDKCALVDGRPGVLVRNVGTPQKVDFRLLDPEADAVFGKALTPVSQLEPLEFSTLSAADGISPGHYPALLPLTAKADGLLEFRISRQCDVQVIARREGVFDILVDGQVYQLDAGAADAAMRRLATNRLSSRAVWLEETTLCRTGRNLVPVPCTTAVKLTTRMPEPVREGSTSPKRTGKYPSHAMDAREFTLARLSASAADTAQTVDVFVNEGKFCKWAESPEAIASTSTQAPTGKMVVPLAQEERELFSLPEAPVYLPELDGALSTDGIFGVPDNYPLEDARFIYAHAPVIDLKAVAQGVNDARTLRGIRMHLADTDWIFVEPDTGVFYKARTPVDGRRELKFARVSNAEEINEYIRLSEQYRLVREHPDAVTDQENIARLLFDLLDESERAAWNVSWRSQITTYDAYARWCLDKGSNNELLEFASNILAGEEIQKRFVELARQSIPDFRKVAQRSIPEQQHIVEVLNRLLPVPGSRARWEALSLESITTPRAVRNILRQVKGANLSFAQVYTESGERVVYYALSGGEKAKALNLQLDTTETTEHVLDGIIFRDARARMAGRLPDPRFTSLPVVRDASRLVIREFNRHLDSERLIATVLKEDMASVRLSHIRFFTVLDTCRSCGGFVLPRLKLDFPGAEFSVTYMKDYTLS